MNIHACMGVAEKNGIFLLFLMKLRICELREKKSNLKEKIKGTYLMSGVTREVNG